MVRFSTEHFLQVGERSFGFISQAIGVAAIATRPQEIWIELQGGGVIRDGLVGRFLPQVIARAPGVRFGTPGIDANCFGAIGDGAIVVLVLPVGPSAADKDGRIAGIAAEGFAEIGNGLLRMVLSDQIRPTANS